MYLKCKHYFRFFSTSDTASSNISNIKSISDLLIIRGGENTHIFMIGLTNRPLFSAALSIKDPK